MGDRHKQIVRQKLEAIGYAVSDIAEGKEPSADLAAEGPGVSLIVEVKARRDDKRIARQLRAGPPRRVIGSHSPILHDDYLSDLVHNAAKQIRSSQRRYAGLGVLWFRADPELGISHADEKMLATLLGRRSVYVRDSDGVITTGRCYLAGYADFYRHKVIDMAVVDDPSDGSRLLVNPYSVRLDDVRACRLFNSVAETAPGAIIDLHRLKEFTSDYVLPGDFSRRDQATVLAELKKRYPNRDFQLFDMQSNAGYIRMDA